MADGYPIREFIREVAGIVVEERDPQRIVALIAPFVRRFLSEGSGMPEYARHAQGGQATAHLLHREGDDSFFIMTIAMPPGAEGAIHCHNSWIVSGVLEGIEAETLYRRETGPEGAVEFAQSGSRRNAPGAISALTSPEEFHALANPGAVLSLVIDVLSGSPESHLRLVYDPQSKSLTPSPYTIARAS